MKNEYPSDDFKKLEEKIDRLQKLEFFESDDRIIIIDKDNEGHGKTLVKGYDLAIKMDVDYILQIDSDDQIPLDELQKLFVYINILIVICVSVFLMFSKKNEPKEFPEKFSKKYTLKLPRL